MSIVTGQDGCELVAYWPGASLEIPPEARDIPLVFALVALRHTDGWLFVFNTFRQQWELPGGQIDPGETPAQAALRELEEESGQSVPLRYAGLSKMRLIPDSRLELGAIYTAELATVRPFAANTEIERMMLWDLEATITDGPVNDIDRALALLVDGKWTG
jgi:8-oxo-dGTP pyrophosphatase MutT (NUDIX family)